MLTPIYKINYSNPESKEKKTLSSKTRSPPPPLAAGLYYSSRPNVSFCSIFNCHSPYHAYRPLLPGLENQKG